jgi:hypothetical protein
VPCSIIAAYVNLPFLCIFPELFIALPTVICRLLAQLSEIKEYMHALTQPIMASRFFGGGLSFFQTTGWFQSRLLQKS